MIVDENGHVKMVPPQATSRPPSSTSSSTFSSGRVVRPLPSHPITNHASFHLATTSSRGAGASLDRSFSVLSTMTAPPAYEEYVEELPDPTSSPPSLPPRQPIPVPPSPSPSSARIPALAGAMERLRQSSTPSSSHFQPPMPPVPPLPPAPPVPPAAPTPPLMKPTPSPPLPTASTSKLQLHNPSETPYTTYHPEIPPAAPAPPAKMKSSRKLNSKQSSSTLNSGISRTPSFPESSTGTVVATGGPIQLSVPTLTTRTPSPAPSLVSRRSRSASNANANGTLDSPGTPSTTNGKRVIQPFEPSQPPLSHLRLISASDSLSGCFTLDPSIKQQPFSTPPSAGPMMKRRYPPADDSKGFWYTSSAYIFSESGHVKSRFECKDGKSKEQPPKKKLKTRTHIVVGSGNGNVKTEIFSRHSKQLVTLHLRSSNGNIQLFLPPQFSGPLSFKIKGGVFRPSPLMRKRLNLWQLDQGIGVGEILNKPKGKKAASGYNFPVQEEEQDAEDSEEETGRRGS
ncbi:hypothetical protein BT69DRAFT_1356434, partial [Atractiella rhizophila]